VESEIKRPWNTAGSVATEDMPRKLLNSAVTTKPRPMGGLERSVRPPSSPMAANGFPGGEREGGESKRVVRRITEPLGDVIFGFMLRISEASGNILKRKFEGFKDMR